MFRRRNSSAPFPTHPRAARDREGDEVGLLLGETAARIEELIAAAEQTASSVRGKAEAIGDDSVEGQRGSRIVRELALGLVERVDGLAREASELRRILERSARVFGQSDLGPEDPRPQSPPDSGAGKAAPQAQVPWSASRIARRGGEGPSQGIVLLATQMAVAGSERDEIATRLRDDFGVTDTEAVLAEALGGAR